MFCSIINEGTAPRHALGGSLPASKPVAPKQDQYTRYGSCRPNQGCAGQAGPRPQRCPESPGLPPRAGRPVEATWNPSLSGAPAEAVWLAASSASHDARLVALPVPVFIHSPLIVLLLTLGKTNGQFGAPVFPVQLQGNERVSLSFNRTDET
jgi:hypothetical protein